MRVAKLQLPIVLLALLALAASACQTAQRPAPLLPARTAPPLTSTAPVPAPQQAAPSTPKASDPEKPPAPAEASAETSAKTPPATNAPDPVAELIAKVEKDFQAGLDAYKAGHPDVAKQDFDKAFNGLLESNLDVRSDDRLEQEFNRIVEAVNHLDMGALASDSDSEAQKTEPAPIDETNGITPSADPGIRAKAQAEIKSTHSDLPLMMTDQVAGYISYFSNHGRGVFERAYARSGRYHDMMA